MMSLILEKFVRVFCLETKASFNSSFVLLIFFSILLLFLILIFLNPFSNVLKSVGDKSCNSFFKTKSFFSKYGVDISFSQSKNFCDVSFVKIPSSTDSEVKSFFANSMIDCWNKYGRGSTELFHNTGTNYYCVLCSYISFDDSYNKKIVGFKDYLKENYVPFYPYRDYTYIEFLANCDLEKCNGDFYFADLKNNDFSYFGSKNYDSEKDFDVIDTSKNYGVLYLIYEKNAVIKKLDALIISSSIAVGSVIVAALLPVSIPITIISYGAIATVSGVSSGKVLFDYASKDPEWNAGVVVLPYDQVKLLNCENIERISSNS